MKIYLLPSTSKEERWIREGNEWLEVCRLICHGFHFLEISSKIPFTLSFCFLLFCFMFFLFLVPIKWAWERWLAPCSIKWTSYWNWINRWFKSTHGNSFMLYFLCFSQSRRVTSLELDQCTEFRIQKSNLIASDILDSAVPPQMYELEQPWAWLSINKMSGFPRFQTS